MRNSVALIAHPSHRGCAASLWTSVLITLIGLGLVLATAIALAWPLLSPPIEETRDAEPTLEDELARLVAERDGALAAIREADFDHETGKLSDEDHSALRAELEERALAALAALERSSPTAPGRGAPTGGVGAPSAFCPACGHANRSAAQFCVRCRKTLARPRDAKRRQRA